MIDPKNLMKVIQGLAVDCPECKGKLGLKSITFEGIPQYAAACLVNDDHVYLIKIQMHKLDQEVKQDA